MFALSLICFALSATNSARAETKSWVVSWFYMATYSNDGDCPGGLNPPLENVYREILKGLGKTPEEIAVAFKDGGGNGVPRATQDLIVNRGRVDGKPVNEYLYPESVPDPHIHLVDSRFGFGFNLDGRGAASPNGFEDPDTHERGVNNQLFRVLGCTEAHRARPPNRPQWAGTYQWASVRDSMPAWLITVNGADLSKNGKVTVTLDRALKHVSTDANGSVLADATFEIDPAARSHNVLQGVLENGKITTDPAGEFHMAGDPFYIPEFNFRELHMRLKLESNGGLTGLVGGYQPWADIYWMHASAATEFAFGVDIVGFYYGLKHLADAYPDPKNGQNTHISTAYQIEAIPAFAVPTQSHEGKAGSASQTAVR